MSVSAPVTPAPRTREARFLAQELVPFVERAIDALLARRGGQLGRAAGVAGLSGASVAAPEISGLDAFLAAAGDANAAIIQVAIALGLQPIDVAVLAFAVAPYLEPRVDPPACPA